MDRRPGPGFIIERAGREWHVIVWDGLGRREEIWQGGTRAQARREAMARLEQMAARQAVAS